jgi:signal transduction histidine kinase
MLNDRLQHVQDEERTRLAADLHDEALQTALYLQRQLATGDHNRTATAEQLALSDTLVDQLHRVCEAMWPAALDGLGIVAALEVMSLELGNRTGTPIYRTAQEALNNALRHAHPTCLWITLYRSRNSVILRVADDGTGFIVPASMDSLAVAGHLGLAGLQHRVHGAGGHLSITSTVGTGTVVQMSLPVEGGTR